MKSLDHLHAQTRPYGRITEMKHGTMIYGDQIGRNKGETLVVNDLSYPTPFTSYQQRLVTLSPRTG